MPSDLKPMSSTTMLSRMPWTVALTISPSSIDAIVPWYNSLICSNSVSSGRSPSSYNSGRRFASGRSRAFWMSRFSRGVRSDPAAVPLSESAAVARGSCRGFRARAISVNNLLITRGWIACRAKAKDGPRIKRGRHYGGPHGFAGSTKWDYPRGQCVENLKS